MKRLLNFLPVLGLLAILVGAFVLDGPRGFCLAVPFVAIPYCWVGAWLCRRAARRKAK